jgi:hypothetical protein
LRAPPGGRGQQFAGRQFQAGLADALTLLIEAGPHQHV